MESMRLSMRTSRRGLCRRLRLLKNQSKLKRRIAAGELILLASLRPPGMGPPTPASPHQSKHQVTERAHSISARFFRPVHDHLHLSSGPHAPTTPRLIWQTMAILENPSGSRTLSMVSTSVARNIQQAPNALRLVCRRRLRSLRPMDFRRHSAESDSAWPVIPFFCRPRSQRPSIPHNGIEPQRAGAKVTRRNLWMASTPVPVRNSLAPEKNQVALGLRLKPTENPTSKVSLRHSCLSAH
jgi:hypothetical protein